MSALSSVLSPAAPPTAPAAQPQPPSQTPPTGPVQLMQFQVPDNAQPGQQMMVCTPQGMQYMVVVPQGATPGSTFQIAVPAAAARQPQVMLVQVPPNVQPGQQMVVCTPQGGQYMVTVPPGAAPGSTFQIAVPNNPSNTASTAKPVQRRKSKQAPSEQEAAKRAKPEDKGSDVVAAQAQTAPELPVGTPAVEGVPADGGSQVHAQSATDAKAELSEATCGGTAESEVKNTGLQDLLNAEVLS